MVKWCKIVKNPWLQGLLHKLLTCGAASLAAWAARLEALPTWRFVAMKWSCLNTRKEAIKTHTCLYIYIYTHSCELSSFFFQVISMDDNHPMMLMHPYTNSPQKVRWVVAASSKEWAWATTSTTPKCPKMTRRPRKTLGILRRSLDRWTTSLKDINL